MASKFYIVWKGRAPGIYTSWNEASAQVNGFAGAQFVSVDTRAAAEAAYAAGHDAFRQNKPAFKPIPEEVKLAYAVDASLPAETGLLEYRGVKIDTRQEIFRQGPFAGGTNNIGEFLGIVHALALFKQKRITAPLYSDSRTAIAWVRNKHAKTELARSEENAPLFDLIARAEAWLRENTYSTKVLKWDTEAWGENPADFGRK
jgi:ribonuclease HI